MPLDLKEFMGKNGGPLIMGILNVTPDSFSDGGRYADVEMAVNQAVQMKQQGAQIIDIGGESTRPNAQSITIAEECARVISVIKEAVKKGCIVSLDTRNAITMDEGINAGAHIINDVSALEYDPEAISVLAQAGVPVCLMHAQGTPQTMQANPQYNNVVDDVYAYLEGRLNDCVKKGVRENQIILDVGIGFGKTLEHNLSLIKNIDTFRKLNRPLLLGASRKSFIGKINQISEPEMRFSGSLAANLYALAHHVDIFRVHDVVQTKQAFDVWRAINEA